MLTDATTWVQLLLGLLALIGILGLVVAYLRVSLAKATIDTLKESNEALTHRNSELDDVIREMKVELLDLKRENEVLRSAVANKESNEQVIAVVNHHHEEVMSDRRVFEDRFTQAQVTLGDKLDVNHRLLLDVVRILGHHRAAEEPSS